MTVKFENNADQVLAAMEQAKAKTLYEVGAYVEGAAKLLAPVGTPESTGIAGYQGGTLRASITHEEGADYTKVGSPTEYAPYVELGTGGKFEKPPDWVEITTTKGAAIIDGMKAQPFLRPAVLDNADTIKQITENNYTNA